MDMFSFTRFCLRVLADLNEIIRRMKRKVILTIAIIPQLQKRHNGFVVTMDIKEW
jgi:hypothetical protein